MQKLVKTGMMRNELHFLLLNIIKLISILIMIIFMLLDTHHKKILKSKKQTMNSAF